MFTSLFNNTLLCMSFVYVIIEPKLEHEIGLFSKQTSTFPKLNIGCS